MNGKTNCCYQCEERHVGCHAECEKYAESRKVYEARRDALVKDRILRNYTVDQYDRNGRYGYGSLKATTRRIEREHDRKFETELRKGNKKGAGKKDLHEP